MTVRTGTLLTILMACGFIVVGQLYVTIPSIGATADRFGVSPAAAASIGSAFGFAYAAGFFIFGPLSDRYGRRRVLALGLVSVAGATVLVGLAPSFGLLISARVLQGVAASTFPPAALSLVAESLPPAQRPFGISLMSFAFLGAAPAAPFLAAQSGQDLPTIMLGLAPLYLAGAAALYALATARPVPAAEAAGPLRRQLPVLLADRHLVAAWAAAPTILFAFVAFHTAAQALEAADGVIDVQTLRLAGLPPLLLTFLAAPLIGRFGPAATARLGLTLSALSMAVAVVGTPVALTVASIGLSTGLALAVPGLIATVAGRTGQTARGLALAVYTFSLFVGASIAAPVAQGLTPWGGGLVMLLPVGLLVLASAGLAVTRDAKPIPVP